MDVETDLPNGFSQAVIELMKGVVYHQKNANAWDAILKYRGKISDYVHVIGLNLVIDEEEGYAWLKTVEVEEGNTALPRLVERRQLSYPVSLLIVLLRQKMVEKDSGGEEQRIILSYDEIIEMMKTFLPDTANEAKIIDNIHGYINRVIKLGFIRRLRGQDRMIEVNRILKSFVDIQWLTEFDERLTEYYEHVKEEERA